MITLYYITLIQQERSVYFFHGRLKKDLGSGVGGGGLQYVSLKVTAILIVVSNFLKLYAV